jgi:DNA-binding PadR family transcriptional regulator
MRRKPGVLLPLEVSILEAALEIAARGSGEFYGYLIASAIKQREDRRTLTAHGTLYKALDRMKKAGLLESRWEDPETAALEERPRRRLYHVTAAGESALAEALRSTTLATATARLAPGVAG